ncbi:MAG: hypothetical protein WAQ33_15670, partial [Gaiellaceae bacterium]
VSVRQAAFAIVVLVLLAGCGGGGGSSRLSKSEFDAKANAICDKYQAMINAVGQPQSVTDVPGYIDKVLPLLREGTSKLDALKPPADLQSTFDEWRQIQRDQVDEAVALKKAADKGDAAEVSRIANEASAKNKRSNELASQLGAKTCAKD